MGGVLNVESNQGHGARSDERNSARLTRFQGLFTNPEV